MKFYITIVLMLIGVLLVSSFINFLDNRYWKYSDFNCPGHTEWVNGFQVEYPDGTVKDYTVLGCIKK